MSSVPLEKSMPTPIIDSGDAEQKRAEIRRYFLHTWELYESLFELLADDTVFYQRPEPLRHPLIFYFGHTATFFINKLAVSKLIDRRLRPSIESMMAIGVDEMSWDDLDESHYDWPSADEVRSYRDEVKSIVLRSDRRPPPEPPRAMARPILDHPHGNRARAHSPRNLLRPHPPAPTLRCQTAQALAAPTR